MAKNAKVRTVKAWAVVAEGVPFSPNHDIRDTKEFAEVVAASRTRSAVGEAWHPVPITITFAARREGRK